MSRARHDFGGGEWHIKLIMLIVRVCNIKLGILSGQDRGDDISDALIVDLRLIDNLRFELNGCFFQCT